MAKTLEEMAKEYVEQMTQEELKKAATITVMMSIRTWQKAIEIIKERDK